MPASRLRGDVRGVLGLVAAAFLLLVVPSGVTASAGSGSPSAATSSGGDSTATLAFAAAAEAASMMSSAIVVKFSPAYDPTSPSGEGNGRIGLPVPRSFPMGGLRRAGPYASGRMLRHCRGRWTSWESVIGVTGWPIRRWKRRWPGHCGGTGSCRRSPPAGGKVGPSWSMASSGRRRPAKSPGQP